jgi:hypothetical protein
MNFDGATQDDYEDFQGMDFGFIDDDDLDLTGLTFDDEEPETEHKQLPDHACR